MWDIFYATPVFWALTHPILLSAPASEEHEPRRPCLTSTRPVRDTTPLQPLFPPVALSGPSTRPHGFSLFRVRVHHPFTRVTSVQPRESHDPFRSLRRCCEGRRVSVCVSDVRSWTCAPAPVALQSSPLPEGMTQDERRQNLSWGTRALLRARRRRAGRVLCGAGRPCALPKRHAARRRRRSSAARPGLLETALGFSGAAAAFPTTITPHTNLSSPCPRHSPLALLRSLLLVRCSRARRVPSRALRHL